jgi:predicted site-specific integrase-resolvase
MASSGCAMFFCQNCRKLTRFLHIDPAANSVSVSRRTIYDWMDHEWIHWRILPSGRRMICEESLSHVGTNGNARV